MNKILFVFYQVARAVRYTTLLSVFGYVSHCPQTPTCGSYFLEQVRTHGLFGVINGLKRTLSCYR